MFRKSLALSSRHPRGVGHFTGGFLVTYLLSRKAIFLPLICPTCQTAATRAARSKDYRKSIRSGPSSGKYVSPKSTLRDNRQTAPTIMPKR